MNRIKIYSFLILCFAIIGISKAQNVGVGTTTPQNKFHVNGQIRVDTLISGTLTADSVVLVGTNGVFKKTSFNATPDPSLGSVAIFPFLGIPSDYLECNGQAVSRTTYAALFAKIGITYGAGNGSTTFNIPDLRGEFVRGWSNGRSGVDVGRNLGSWQVGSSMVFRDGNSSGNGINFEFNDDVFVQNTTWDGGGGGRYSTPYTIPNTGITINNRTVGFGMQVSPMPANYVLALNGARPRNVAMVYAIKAKESVMVPTATSTAVTTAAIANEPWYNVATGTAATANTQDIYQMGNVGINTTSPSTKLHIDNGTTAGAIRIIDGTQGAGKVLTSDANGVGTWKTSLVIDLSKTGMQTLSTDANQNILIGNVYTASASGMVSCSGTLLSKRSGGNTNAAGWAHWVGLKDLTTGQVLFSTLGVQESNFNYSNCSWYHRLNLIAGHQYQFFQMCNGSSTNLYDIYWDAPLSVNSCCAGSGKISSLLISF
jgi:uncharacterized SAM-binding protein YcdF (DUF218 family)